MHLGGLVNHLVHGTENEVAILHFSNGPHPRHRGADCSAYDRIFRDWRVDDTVAAELFRQTERDGETSTETFGNADVFAQ